MTNNDLLPKIVELCKVNKIKPQKSRGQNFLVSSEVYNQIVATADLAKTDLVLEVGPGLGLLTERLAKQAQKVLAVELDGQLVAYLRKKVQAENIDNLEIVSADILRADELLPDLKTKPYKIVANLPYNITAVFLRKFWELNNKPSLMVLLLQKEVAERLAAGPGAMSLLTLAGQIYGRAEIIKGVPAESFYPAPKVDSAIIKLTPAPVKIENATAFWRLARIGFSARRKMLKNNFANGLKISNEIIMTALHKCALGDKVRPQELSLKDWQNLFAELKEFVI